MKIETLNNKKKNTYLFGLLTGVVLLLIVLFSSSYAKYRNTESINIVKGVINYKPYDVGLVAINVEDENITGKYNTSDKVPVQAVLNEELSYCEVDGVKDENINIIYNFSNDYVNFEKVGSKGTKCYLYFDVASAAKSILANKDISKRTDFTVTYTTDTTGTLFTAEDDDGTSYYYAGSPKDNYVKFAGKYWRIIRINGDGSIRMIYAGDAVTIDALSNKTTVLANSYNDSTTQYTQTEKNVFNSINNNNAHGGFMYTSGELRGLGTSSTIKGILDTWYNNNLISYADKIDFNTGFCGDRTPSTSSSSIDNLGGTGATVTYYAGYIRLFYQLYNQKQTSASPTLKCANSSDLYTVGTSYKGNKALTNPIGLISAEEVAYAGGLYNTVNVSYYLYTGNAYWTLSPFQYNGSGAFVLYVSAAGLLNGYDVSPYVNYRNGIRPVINLKADTVFKDGSEGTIEKPYIVEGAE